MRSPPLMSPTQAPMAPQAAMPRPVSNEILSALIARAVIQTELNLKTRFVSGEMVTQPIRMVPTPQQPVIPSQFFTYEPNLLMNVHPDICLAGCVLHMFDMDRMFTDKLDLPNIVLAIRMHGGDIEFGAKAYAERAGAITHVIVESIRTQHAHLVKIFRISFFCILEVSHFSIRLCTKRSQTFGVQLQLVVLTYDEGNKWTYIGHVILPSVILSDGLDPLQRKDALLNRVHCEHGTMFESVVLHTRILLSRHNNILIAKSGGVEKVEKAREWDIQVVNYQWLADNYAGQRVEADNQRYQLGQPCEGVSPGPYALEMINDQFKQLLLAWKMPVIVTPEQWRRSFDTKQAVENDEGVFPNKKLRMQSAPPSEAEIAAKAQEHQKSGITHPAYVVAFSGIDDENKHKLRYLGGRACEEVSECTHLGDDEWSTNGTAVGGDLFGKEYSEPLLDNTLDYFLHDEDQERHLGYNCKRSVVRARHKKVFEDVQFYITPSVEPSRAVLTKLIRLAGGTVHEDRPAPADIARCIETDAPYIVISCECDLRMVQYLLECNFPVYNTDMVLIALDAFNELGSRHAVYSSETAC
ncbi:hypothetical protein COOONC_08158 [Cooperia oncophora]